MVPGLLLSIGLFVGVTPTAGTAPEADRMAYEAVRDKLGRDPQAHVRLALWCERNGLETERVKHLALAVLIDPRNAAARGLLGLVAFRGRWEHPEAISVEVSTDE